ncbi:MAG: hypothetical protein ACK5Y8_21045 [Betaproteobacteria bacterium]
MNFTRFVAAAACAALLAGTAAAPARAHGGLSEASALSMLPLAVSVAAPALVLSAGAGLTVVAVQASGEATVWVLERASVGARASVTVSGAVAGGASLLVGTAVAVTAVSAGWVLSAAGQVIAFVPNEIGKALLHNERITR